MKVDDNSLWSGIVGQDDAIEKIVCSLDPGEQNHAWLFVGPRGVGKRTTAKVLASALNCEDRGCGGCVSCNKVMRDLHPDIHLIEPEGNFILIEQIDVLLGAVSLKNFEGRTKVIIVDDADRMTSEAANSLLKTLEEPPAEVVFILVSSNLEAVLPTIMSRCRIVQFKSLPVDDIISFLMHRYSMRRDEAELATHLSGGILGSAISFAVSPAKKERRMAVLRAAQQIDRVDLARISFMAEDFLNETKRPLGELKIKQKQEFDELKKKMGQAEIPAGVKKRLEQRHKREAGHEEQQGFLDVLNVLASWYRDIMLLHETGREDILSNLDQTLLVKEHTDILTSAEACMCLDVIEKTRQYSRFNVNMQLAFEEMLFKIHETVAVQEAPYN